MMEDAAGLLDVEYREFVRNLHDSTIAICVEVQSWFSNPCQRVLGTLLGERAPTTEDVQGAASALQRWQDDMFPQLSVLITGHPDPDVRDAAQLLALRVRAVKFVLGPVLRGAESAPDLDLVRRVYDPSGEPLRRLRHAVRDAPFRVHRPPSPSMRERYPEDRSFDDFPQTFFLWLDRLERWERDFHPAGSVDV